MSLRVLFFCALTLFAAPSLVSAQGVLVTDGFYAGNTYRELSEAARRTYVSGVIDGIFVSTLFDANFDLIDWLKRCVTGMNNGQVTAIVDLFLSAHPERWDQGMHVLVYTAMLEGCEKRGFKRPAG